MKKGYGVLTRLSPTRSANLGLALLRRSISINSAINHSLRKTQRGRQRTSSQSFLQDQDHRGHLNRHVRKDDGRDSNATRHDKCASLPLTIPYTTSASEFLYGTSAVKAALEARRRKCYKLYIYVGDNRETSEQDIAIRRLALRNEVVVERIKSDKLRLMDKMSEGRPHNVGISTSTSILILTSHVVRVLFSKLPPCQRCP